MPSFEPLFWPLTVIVHFRTSSKASFPSLSLIGVKVITQFSVTVPLGVNVFVTVMRVVGPSLFCLLETTGAAIALKARTSKSKYLENMLDNA